MKKIRQAIESQLKELYEENLPLLRKGCFVIRFNNRDFDISSLEGSSEDSFDTLIHHILYANNLYQIFCDASQLKAIEEVMENSPSLPPAIPPDSEDDYKAEQHWYDICGDAMEFTYKYLKSKDIQCEEYESYSQEYGLDW